MVRISFRETKTLITKTHTKQSRNARGYSKFITAKFQEILPAFLRAVLVYGISVSLNTRNAVCDENDIRACLTPIKTTKLGVSLHRYHQGFSLHAVLSWGGNPYLLSQNYPPCT
jgi:hypothetical protein